MYDTRQKPSGVMRTREVEDNSGLKRVGWKKGKSVCRAGRLPTCLLTIDIGPCIAASFWCPLHQTVSLIHIHPDSDDTREKLSKSYQILHDEDQELSGNCKVQCNVRGGLGCSSESKRQYEMLSNFCREKYIALFRKGCLEDYKPDSTPNNQPVLGISPTDGEIYTGIME